jgi:hypothetical protein
LPMAPSVNEMYFNSRSGRTLTKKAREYKLLARSLISQSPNISKVDTSNLLGMVIDVYVHNARRDATNVVKIIEDCAFEALGVNDNKDFIILVRKFFGGEDTIVILLGPADEIANRISRMTNFPLKE